MQHARGRRFGTLLKFERTVWIEPLIESEFNEVRKLIDEHSDAVFSSRGRKAGGENHLLFYSVHGTVRDIDKVKKQFRRLSRGKIKFRAVW